MATLALTDIVNGSALSSSTVNGIFAQIENWLNGVTASADITITGALTAGSYTSTGNITINTNKFTVAGATGNTVIAGTLGVSGTTTAVAITASGAISTSLTTDSTSGSTGSIYTSGGLGVTKAAFIGTNLGIGIAPSSTYKLYLSSSDTSDLSMRIYHANSAGDPSIVLTTDVTNWSLGLDNSDSDSFKICYHETIGTNTALTIAKTTGDVSIASSTASTSTTTGALVVTGGGAFGGNINVGGYIGIGTSSYLYFKSTEVLVVNSLGNNFIRTGGTQSVRFGMMEDGSAWSSGGNYNTAVGSVSMVSTSLTGQQNTGCGRASLYSLTSGSYNTGIGAASLVSTTTASNNIGLGYHSGFYETGSSKLFIDAFDRGSESAGRTGAIIYGVMNATASSQTLALNATVSVLGDIYSVIATDFTSSCTVTNNGAGTVKVVWYKKRGKNVLLHYRIQGTGSGGGAAVTLSLPFASANTNGSNEFVAPFRAMDNGTTKTTPGMAVIANNASVVTLYSDWNNGAWTNGGNNSMWGYIEYEAA